MICATISEVDGGHFAEIKGHARYAPKGQDIVCAGVSAVVGAVVGRLDEMAVSGEITYRARSVSDGYVFIDFVTGDNPFSVDRADTLMCLLYHGLCGIEDEFPDFVTVKE